MDRRQKEVQRELLGHEEKVLEQLKDNYRAALKDIRARIQRMEADPDFKGKQIRHAKYQRMLEAQLETILHKLGDENASDMTAYLDTVYREAYLGCLYGMHGDGVDLILQVDEDKVLRCINKDTKELKFSARIYDNVDQLKDTVKAEISRGFSSGKDYAAIARQISLRAGTSLTRMYTIARTEGHRVTSESEMECMRAAKAKGADVVKEWISTLDSVTRKTHVELDGQIRELEEYFEIPSSGAKAMYPGGFGIACEDINCRCCMNQRARWNLQSEEYRYSRSAGEVVSIKSENYRRWKEGYRLCCNVILENAEGKTTYDTAKDKVKFLECYENLSRKAQEVINQYKVVFGTRCSQTNPARKIMELEQNVLIESVYHEIGHALEAGLFKEKEVEAFKRRYLEGLEISDVVTMKAKAFMGDYKKDVYVVRSNRFIQKYQGRLYIEALYQACNPDGSIDSQYLQEFLSVPIEIYYTDPERLKRFDAELYRFIRRNVE
ncbi:MAG: hypothetical protein HDP34_00595 [Clostridia bacterium]|nr:hypothetical protein [Clostridia bacterium]